MLEYKLKRETELYWRFALKENSIDEVLNYYIYNERSDLPDKSLLKTEINYAKNKKNVKAAFCQTLVLLVGLSLEPLLQSVYVYKPKKIVLVLNEEGYPVLDQEGECSTEDPSTFADHMVNAVNALVERLNIDKPEIESCPTKENKVFKTLVTALHDEDNVVIDITGGKKSMVTSAFLYAAFSGARISYVDFESYCVKNRRPYGFNCKIGELANPYRDFSLREWEKTRVLYNRYQFNEALQMLADIKTSMTEVLPDSKEPIEKLIHFIEFYNKWDSGDFRSAKKKADELQQIVGQFKFPSAVEFLGGEGDWYEFDDPGYKPTPIYGDLGKLKVYVCDEMARIERLIKYNEDYRSAFLQTGGVSEMIMLGRLLHLVVDLDDRTLLLNKLIKDTPGAGMVLDAFSDSNRNKIAIGHGGEIRFKGFRKKDDPKIEVTIQTRMDPWWQKTVTFRDTKSNGENKNGYSTFLNRRNEVAHKYFPIPKDWAEEGLKFVKANFDDFMINHVEGQGADDYCDDDCCTDALPWSELCELCRVDAFLTPNLRRDI